MTSKKDNLLDWLRDAHAMEQQAEKMLEAQAGRLENYPQLKTRIQQHLEETRGQQRLLEGCLERPLTGRYEFPSWIVLLALLVPCLCLEPALT